MKKITYLLVSIFTVLGFSALVCAVLPHDTAQAADISNNLCKGADLRLSGGADCSQSNKGASEKLDKIVTDVVNIFSVIVGVVAVIMIIYGGFRYIISGGDSSNVTNAKNTILYALIGLVIVALAQFIVKFVLSKATGLGN
jgi:Type IV secretion system pilin